jgi:hypothetical protein
MLRQDGSVRTHGAIGITGSASCRRASPFRPYLDETWARVSLVPKLSVLSPEQHALWPALGATRALGFVLYGGTAVALRLGHRASEDFDFFSDRPLDRDAMSRLLPLLDNAERIQDESRSLTVLATSRRGDVKISFFGALRMGRVGEPDVTNDGVLEVASQDDLLALKLKVILERAEAKDYHDIAAMLSAGSSLERGLGAAQALFGREFAPAIALRALTYFDDPALRSITRQERTILSRESAAIDSIPEVAVVSKSLSI